VLTRFVAEETSLAAVARKALQVMHFAINDEGALPEDPSALVDEPSAPCVAACYRCLMSYYNQPDHELIDRRDEAAKEILLRLARCTTVPVEVQVEATFTEADSASVYAQWFAEAARRGIPAVDAVPLADDGWQARLVWRRSYVAATVDGADAIDSEKLEELGFDVIQFGNPATWNEGFARLAAALGKTA
jgi:hypothetical protein